MRKTGAFAALLFLIALATIGSHDAVRATTFTPIDHSVTLSNSAPSTNATVTVSISVDSPSALDEAHVSFIPSAWSVADDSSIPNGADVGSVSLSIAESEDNGACNVSRLLSFQLYDATTNTASNLLADDPRIPSASWPGFADSNGNNLADAIDRYPTFLKNAYPGLTPRSRAYGFLDVIPDVNPIKRVVNVLVFDPGTALPGMSPMSASLGYIVVVVPQDPTAPAAASTITDQCSPFIYTRQDRGLTQNNGATAANEDGFVYRTNPATDGTYTFFEYLRSLRDFDNDGIENVLDTCPYVSTPSWNPRISDAIHDPDGDGIPGRDDLSQSGEQLLPDSGCDPNPITSSTDADADGFLNRQDNCPLVANATQEDPDGDRIGSACDTVNPAPDGHLHEVCSAINVDVGAAGTPPTLTCPEFVPDMDNDGYTNSAESGTPLCAGSADDDADTFANDGCPAVGAPEAACTGSADDDTDTFVNDGCPQSGAFSEAQFKIGTNPQDNCGSHTTSGPIYSQAWPADLFGSPGQIPETTDRVTLQDLTSFLAPVRYFNTSPGNPNYNQRWDIVPGSGGVLANFINLEDLTNLILLSPDMFGGVRAFNGPACTP